MITSYTLKKPITVHGKNGAEQLAALTLKEPSGDLYLQHGPPFETIVIPGANGDGNKMQVKPNPPIFKLYLMQMTGLDAGAIGQISPADLASIYGELVSEINSGGNSETLPTS